MKNGRVIQTFLDVVKIPSPSGQEEAVMGFLGNYLRGMHIQPMRDYYGNMIIKIPGFGEPLLLSAHVDTVMPCMNVKPTIHNDRILTDGTTILGADNKAALAVILEVITLLHDSPHPHRPLEVVFTKSEEEGNYGSRKLDYSLLSAKEGYTFDDGEPIGKIVQAAPYYFQIDILLTGTPAHSSNPEHGINVLPIFIDAMKDFSLGKIKDGLLVNFGIIEGGFARNTIPGQIHLKGEIRSFTEEDALAQFQLIQKNFLRSATAHDGKVMLTIDCESKGYQLATDDSFVMKTLKIMDKIHIQPIFHTTYGCSDANVYNAHGIKVIDLGDGTKDPHTVKESIAIADINQMVQLVHHLIRP